MYQVINSNIVDFQSEQKYHAIISDPPYGLAFMGKKWDKFKKPIDYQKWVTEWSSHLMQFLYPGAVCLFFGGTRTYHRLATGLEDAGFEIFDSMMWCYGSGFPKSHNISKAIDSKFGLEREVVGSIKATGTARGKGAAGNYANKLTNLEFGGYEVVKDKIEITKPNHTLAHQWNGYGTVLKPAYEPIVLCRKPLEKGGYVNSVLKYGTSGLNIDGGRIETNDNLGRPISNREESSSVNDYNWSKHPNKLKGQFVDNTNGLGRFPANFGLICTCEKEPCECVENELDRQSGNGHIGHYPEYNKRGKSNVYGKFNGQSQDEKYLPKGGASRFFYTAKASSKERELGLKDLEVVNGLDISGGGGINHPKADAYQARKSDRLNSHPTVKPIKLIEYLATLLLPPIEDSSILIPFSGVGSEMIGCHLAGWNQITGIEIDEHYVEIANKRLDYWTQYDNYQDAISNKLLIDKLPNFE